MPLQKPPPMGMQASDAQTGRRRGGQERRRTLQTISELTSTDVAASDFRSFIKAEQSGVRSGTHRTLPERQSPNHRRRSLPQYSQNLDNLRAHNSPSRPAVRVSASQPSLPNQAYHASSYTSGNGSRKEHSQAQHEQMSVGRRVHNRTSGQQLRVGSQSSLPSATPLPSTSAIPRHLKSYSSQHQLLQNSRSISGFAPAVTRRNSSNAMAGAPREYDTESSGRASTDSGSYQSGHENVSRRPRSGSSIQSFTMQQAAPPPLPTSYNPQRYYAPTSANYYNLAPPAHFSTANQARPTPTPRSSSLNISSGHVQHAPRIAQNLSLSTSSSRRSHQHLTHDAAVQQARMEALATLTSPAPPRATGKRRPSAPPSPNAPPRPQPTHHPKPSRYHSGTRSAYPYPQRRSTGNMASAPSASRTNGTAPHAAVLERRSLPRRESLTQWKAEREEAQAEFGVMRRVDMKERVRRANEMEQEKEEELLRVGKGAGDVTVVVEREGSRERSGKEKGRGCLGGVVRVLLGLGFGGRA
ncbi:hypothetical protein IQ07DRAFT_49237 [Pyrenochaeta sp. DS3sAY3a]|nr:hypothetical protein IQ07DRAFT_49237 [Pyrenochaeta sp. DS3sAY3a]